MIQYVTELEHERGSKHQYQLLHFRVFTRISYVIPTHLLLPYFYFALSRLVPELVELHSLGGGRTFSRQLGGPNDLPLKPTLSCSPAECRKLVASGTNPHRGHLHTTQVTPWVKTLFLDGNEVGRVAVAKMTPQVVPC